MNSDMIGIVLIAVVGLVGLYIVFSMFTGRSVKQNEDFLRQATLRQQDLGQPDMPPAEQQPVLPQQQPGQPMPPASGGPGNDSLPPTT